MTGIVGIGEIKRLIARALSGFTGGGGGGSFIIDDGTASAGGTFTLDDGDA